MSLSIVAGRAKWCVWCVAALASCAPTLSYADHNNTHPGASQPERSPFLLAEKTSRLRRSQQHAEHPIAINQYFGQSAQKSFGDTHFLAVNGGFLGIFNRFPETLRYGAEYRWRELGKPKLRPTIGMVNAENDASYYFLGLRRDFPLSKHVVLSGSFDAGYFEERDEIELGLQMEFRSGAEISYRFNKDYRIGVALYHLSNGGFSDRNPGTESIVLSLISPIR